MTDIKNVKVDKRSPYTFSFKTSYSLENYKKVVVNNRGKRKSAADQLVLQPAHSKKLPIGDKRKQIFSTYSEKINFQIICYFYEPLFQ